MIRPALPGHPPEGGYGKAPSRSMNATPPVESPEQGPAREQEGPRASAERGARGPDAVPQARDPDAARVSGPARQRRGLGLDPRMVSMLLALAAIWIALELLTDGLFLSPRNLYNLSVQASAIAVISCGMVFVIVARQIDLSVGSLLAFTGMLATFVQVNWLEGTPAGWLISIA